MRRIDLVGERFGELTVSAHIPPPYSKKSSGSQYRCTCVCGTEVVRTSNQLRSGSVTHCGCLHGPRISLGKTTHGESKGVNRKGSLRYRMWKAAAQRAKKKGIEFTICLQDITVPEVCPVLGISLRSGVGTACANSPSLDRIDNTKGYTPDNIAVISKKANNIKSDATLDELQRVCAWLLDKQNAG